MTTKTPTTCERCDGPKGTALVPGAGYWHRACWDKATPSQKAAARARWVDAHGPRPGDAWDVPTTASGILIREGCGMDDCGPCRALVARESRVFVALTRSELEALINVAAEDEGTTGDVVRSLARRILAAQAKRPLGCIHPQREGGH